MSDFLVKAGKALLEQEVLQAFLFALGSLERAEGRRRSIDWFNNECFRVYPRVNQIKLDEVLKSLIEEKCVDFEKDTFILTNAGEALLYNMRKARPELQEPSRPKNG